MFIVAAARDFKISRILNNICKQHKQSAYLENKMLGDCICGLSDRIYGMFVLPPKSCHRSQIPPCLAASATAFLQTCLQILFGVKIITAWTSLLSKTELLLSAVSVVESSGIPGQVMFSQTTPFQIILFNSSWK